MSGGVEDSLWRMPSAIRFGIGFGKDKLLDSRPRNDAVTNEVQRRHNDLFQRDILTKERFPDQRPQWFATKTKELSDEFPPSPGRLGEWTLKWIPKQGGGHEFSPQDAAVIVTREFIGSRGSSSLSSRKGSQRSRSVNEISRPDARLRLEAAPSRPTTSHPDSQAVVGTTAPATSSPDIPSAKDPAAGTERRGLSRTSAARGGSCDELGLATARKVRVESRRSGRTGASSNYCSSEASFSTCSGVSFSVKDTAEILKRVKALEEALQGERSMRTKMEAILNQVGDTRPPGVTLRHLASTT